MTALLTDNLPLLAGAPNGIKKLRELILELAVRGKLVEQDASDEPASELLKRIAAEKTQLIAEGKFKKLKENAPVDGAEVLYSLPVGWEWTRLGNLFDIIYGKGLATSELTSDGYEVFGANGIIGRYSSYLYAEPQLLISCRGAYSGKPNISPEFCFVTSNSLVLQNSWKYLNLKFFFYALSIADKERVVTGSAQPQVTTTNLEPFLVVVPPLKEQHRIVAKVDELMALCDRLETQQAGAASAHAQLVQALLGSLTQASDATEFAANWQCLAEHFHTLFSTEPSIDALKQALLQLAVMGKLVPQDASDEPASELLKRIADEKAGFVADGKIKKQKSLAEIADEEKPFSLPANWCWTRAEHVSLAVVDCPHSTPKFVATGKLCLDTNSFKQGRLVEHRFRYVDSSTFNDRNSRLQPRPGDVVFAREGSVGESVVVPVGVECCLGQRVMLFRPHRTNSDYFRLAISEPSALSRILALHKGIGAKHVNVADMRAALLPLPPLPEQHRIVAKLDQLMALCDQLKTQLSQARQLNQQLASTLVEQAVA